MEENTSAEATQYHIVRTDGTNKDFIELCRLLDYNLDKQVGTKFQRSQYTQYNTLEHIHHVVLIYEGNNAVAGGGFKHYDNTTTELKRVFVRPEQQKQGLGRKLVTEICRWAVLCGYKKMILETGAPLVAAMALYRKSGFSIIPNYGQYRNMEASICMEKTL